MSQQQTFTIKQGIRYTAKVSNNDYLFLANVDNLQTQQGKEWYEAEEGLSAHKFLVHLAGLVNYGNFTAEGVEKVIKRLQKRGFVNMEELRIQVTDKWRDIVDEYGGYLNHGTKTTEEVRLEEDKKLLDRLDKSFKELEQPKTLNVREYRKIVTKLVHDGNLAFKRRLKDAQFKGRIDDLQKLLDSDYLLKQYFENALRNNNRAAPPDAPPKDKPDKSTQKRADNKEHKYSKENVKLQIEAFEKFNVTLSMSETDFMAGLKNIEHWFSKAEPRGIELTAYQLRKYNWAMDAINDTQKAHNFFIQKKAEIKAEIDANKIDTYDPSVLAVIANADVKTVKNA